MRNEYVVSIRNTAGTYGNETSCLKYLVECTAVHNEVLYHRETLASPRLDSDGITVMELAHVKLAGGDFIVRSVCTAVYVE